MSKPVLIFWMSALGMGLGSTFGLRIAADSGPQFQEWCIRLPIVLLAMGALFGLYRAVAAVWGKRAGVLVAMVLATMPHWFFLAHQAMTDMPFVAPLTLAIAALMRAVTVGDGGVTPPPRAPARRAAARVALAPHRRRDAGHLAAAAQLPLHPPDDRVVPRRRADAAVHGDAPAEPHRDVAVPGGDVLLRLLREQRRHPREQRAGLTPVGAPRQRGALLPQRGAGPRVAGAGRRRPLAPAPRAPRPGPLLRAGLLLVRDLHDGQGARGPRDPRGRRRHLAGGLGRVASAATRPAADRPAGVPRRGDALVRRHCRTPGQRVHRPLRGARHHQPHRGGRARRHRARCGTSSGSSATRCSRGRASCPWRCSAGGRWCPATRRPSSGTSRASGCSGS